MRCSECVLDLGDLLAMLGALLGQFQGERPDHEGPMYWVRRFGITAARILGTFLTISDDTVKVWVDEKLVVDTGAPHGARLDRGTISLQAGRRYPIRIHHTERTGEAYLKVLWSNPNRRQRIIPTGQLYPS